MIHSPVFGSLFLFPITGNSVDTGLNTVNTKNIICRHSVIAAYHWAGITLAGCRRFCSNTMKNQVTLAGKNSGKRIVTRRGEYLNTLINTALRLWLAEEKKTRKSN